MTDIYEDRCRRCNQLLGRGLPAFHLTDCGDDHCMTTTTGGVAGGDQT